MSWYWPDVWHVSGMRTLFLLPAWYLALMLSAQGLVITMRNDSGTFVLHRFNTGELSSKEWTDAQDRMGRSWAYDRQGKVIYEQQTRSFAGHASVSFRYHPNGAVSRADFSEMPDGGIQWFESTTTFDTNGVQTGYQEDGYDNDGPMRPSVVRPNKPVLTPGVVYEQRMFTNEYFVVNQYPRPVRVELRPKQLSPAAKNLDATLLKGDTLRGGTYSMGELWVPPLSQLTVNVRPAKGQKKLGVVRTDTVQMAPDHRRYYLVIGKAR